MRVREESRKERRGRERLTSRLLKTQKTFEVILAHVRNGGSLIQLCETWGVRYSDIIGWIRADAKRGEQYDKAGADRSEWAKEMLLNELRKLLLADPGRLFYLEGDKAGQPKPIQELDADARRMIREIDADGKVKVYDRLKALELAMKEQRMLTEKVETTFSGSLEAILAASWEKPKSPEAPEAEQPQRSAPQGAQSPSM